MEPGNLNKVIGRRRRHWKLQAVSVLHECVMQDCASCRSLPGRKIQLGLARGHLSGRCSALTTADWVTMPRMCGNAPQCSSLLEAPAPFQVPASAFNA
jgi:hypothetical protein